MTACFSISTTTIVVLVIALLVGLVVRQRGGGATTPKWHEGPGWERLFRIYDATAKEQYSSDNNCQSKLIQSSILTSDDKKESRYTTQVHICGAESPHSSRIMFFHGSAANSLMYGDWLIPELSKEYQTIVVDFPCDLGRSYVADGNIANCPQTVPEIQDWAIDLIEKVVGDLDDSQPISLVGYSYGSFVASQIAIKHPQFVNKLVLFAPAAVFAPMTISFMFHAVAFGLLYGTLPSLQLKDWIRDWFFGWIMAGHNKTEWSDNDKELWIAGEEAGPAIIPVQPFVLDHAALTTINENNPTLLIIGEDEVVIDPDAAIRAAKAANIQVKQCSKSGHMLADEYPARQEVISVVSSFLKD